MEILLRWTFRHLSNSQQEKVEGGYGGWGGEQGVAQWIQFQVCKLKSSRDWVWEHRTLLNCIASNSCDDQLLCFFLFKKIFLGRWCSCYCPACGPYSILNESVFFPIPPPHLKKSFFKTWYFPTVPYAVANMCAVLRKYGWANNEFCIAGEGVGRA